MYEHLIEYYLHKIETCTDHEQTKAYVGLIWDVRREMQ